MKTKSLAFLLSTSLGFFSSVSFGSLSQPYETCAGQLSDGREVRFEIRKTPTGPFVQGTLTEALTQSSLEVFNCLATDITQPDTPVRLLWHCIESSQLGEGEVSIEIVRMSPSGVREGQILQKQADPLPPKVLAQLKCD